MKSLLHSLVVLVVLFGGIRGASAQTNLNWKGYGDTAQFTNWRADSLFISKPFVLTNAENKMLAFVFDDTGSAGRKLDSVKAEIGYQLGTPFVALAGGLDTAWTNIIPVDSAGADTTKMYSGTTAKGGVKWTIDVNDLPVRPHGAIDTSIATTSSAMWIGFQPYWAPLIRFTAKGLTGNNVSGFVRARFAFIQRGYVYVRQM